MLFLSNPFPSIPVMQLWDTLALSNGLDNCDEKERAGKDSASRIVVIGATNRPQDLDSAVQRRFERSFLVGPPDYLARIAVFKAILRNTKKERNFDYKACAKMTEGYTPSDITAVCKAAVAALVNERRRAVGAGTPKRRRYPTTHLERNETSNGRAGIVSQDATASTVPLRPLSIKVR
jgi:SpoVK/Ycf46/Vps4 family AAA+-type ATPase